MKFIVARYNEDISWTNQYENVIIYNKGNPLGLPNEKILPNVGREGHTYYTHIVRNYDNLDDFNVFLQGNPYDHSPNLDNSIKRRRNLPLEWLSKKVLFSTLTYEFRRRPQCVNIFKSYFTIFGEIPKKQSIEYGSGAQFIVSKESILSRPVSFYQKIVDLLSYDINPLEGHDVERFHKLIFCNKNIC